MNKQLHRDVGVGSVLFAFCLWVLYFAMRISGQAAYLPVALATLMMVCAATIIINGLRKSKPAGEKFSYDMSVKEGKNAFLFMAFIFLYYLGFKLIGYWVVTPVFLILTQKYLKVKSWVTIMLVTVIYTAITFVIFVVILKLPIYKIGLLGKYFRIL